MIPQIKILSYYWENGLDLRRTVITNVFKNNYTKFETLKFKKGQRGSDTKVFTWSGTAVNIAT